MEKTQIQAFIITLLLIGGVIFFVIPKSDDWASGFTKWLPSKENFEHSDSKPASKKSKSKKRKSKRAAPSNSPNAQKTIDHYQGVPVYHNGSLGSVFGRHVTEDGYNLGLKYQCVEFVKRFYYQFYDFKMPQSYGHAQEFFNWSLANGQLNRERGLFQYKNGGPSRPVQNAILIFGNDPATPYGHVGIITKVTDRNIEMVSQNNGHNQKSRSKIPMKYRNGGYYIDSKYVLGWLAIQSGL